MKFTCTKENLNNTLSLVSPLASKQSNLPILTNILFQVSDNKVEVVSTNLEVALRVVLRAKVDIPGSYTVPAKILTDYVHLLKGANVIVELIKNELLVTCGNSSTKIKGIPAEDFPIMPDIKEEIGYSVDSDNLRMILTQTIVAVAKNEIKPELSGVYMGFFQDRYPGIIVAATDSYRLAEARTAVKQGDTPFSCIVPSRMVFEIIRLLGLSARQSDNPEKLVRLWLDKSQISVRYGDFEMTSRLIEGRYPDYYQVIPSSFRTTAIVPIGDMVDQIKAASIFTTMNTNAISFDLSPSSRTVGISSVSAQTGEHSSTIETEVEGDENSILLNHRYVLDGLGQMEKTQVIFCVNNGDAPCLFRPKDDESYFYVVMPIRQ
jgi:DNA polymerase III subunit beta